MNEFDEKAKTWDADPKKVERARAVAKAIRKQIPFHPGMTALEYGCGTGMLSFELHPFLSHVTLADSSPGMLDVLRGKIIAQHVQNMTPLRLDLTSDPLLAERYDLIASMMALHHVPDVQSLLVKLFALLNDRGWLCVADLDREDGSFHGPDFSGHNGFGRTAFAAMLAEAGFGNIQLTTVHEIEKETAGGIRRFPLFLATAEKRTEPHEKE